MNRGDLEPSPISSERAILLKPYKSITWEDPRFSRWNPLMTWLRSIEAIKASEARPWMKQGG